MLKKIILSLWFLFCFSVYSNAQESYFKVTILQDTVCTPDENSSVAIQKRPFKIQLTFRDVEGIFLYAAFNDSIYKTAAAAPVPGFKEIPPMCMAEESFNINQELIVSEDGWAYWFYTPKEDWHRFDKDVAVSGKTITGTKTVKQIYFPPIEKSLPIEQLSGPLYLFFFAAKENKKGELVKELQRYKLKLNW